MKFLVEIGPLSALSKPTTIAAFFVAVLVYVFLPALLSVWEYRLTCRQPKLGVCLLIGILASTIILGLYSLIVAAILFGIFVFTLQKNRQK